MIPPTQHLSSYPGLLVVILVRYCAIESALQKTALWHGLETYVHFSKGIKKWSQFLESCEIFRISKNYRKFVGFVWSQDLDDFVRVQCKLRIGDCT
eukprot:jgi/Botrbrau1/21176/Bobra.0061s0068.1